MPLSITGDVVMMFAGLWFAFLVPRHFQKYGYGTAAPTAPASQPLPPPQGPPA